MPKAKRKTLRESLNDANTQVIQVNTEIEEYRVRLNNIEYFADEQYKNGVCLLCPDDGHNNRGQTHSEENPGCWVKELDRLLCL